MGYGVLIFFLVCIMLIVGLIKQIRALIIPARKKTIEIIFMAIACMIILGITYLYAKTWYNSILGILGAVILVLSWARQGIAPKGFCSVRGLWGYETWDTLIEVQVSLQNDVRVSFITKILNENIQYYKKEDYDKIIDLLLEHLSSEIVKIR